MTAYLGTGEARTFIVPLEPQRPLAVSSNYEQFDGLSQLDAPAGAPFVNGNPMTPGAGGTPLTEQTYTKGPLIGLTNTIGAAPFPVDKTNRTGPSLVQPLAGFTAGYRGPIGGPKTSSQNYQGIAQTNQLAIITQNPPIPESLNSIIGGVY